MLLFALLQAGAATGAAPLAPVAFNDNRVAAGRLRNGVFELSLELRRGLWHPLGPDKEAISIFAFGETGKGLETPGPLLRVPLGTRIRVRVHNATEQPVVLHGFSVHRTAVQDTLALGAGASGLAEWSADAEGTYYYWGSRPGATLPERNPEDRLLTGAFIVDPAGTHAAGGTAPRDRVFVI